MGQKTNPISNRIGITRGWDSNWVGGNYAEKIAEDYEIRKYREAASRRPASPASSLSVPLSSSPSPSTPPVRA